MEFLDIDLTNDYSIHSPFYWQILKKTIIYSSFNNPYTKSAEQENSSLFMKRICRMEK
jgi:hypothetical protein